MGSCGEIYVSSVVCCSAIMVRCFDFSSKWIRQRSGQFLLFGVGLFVGDLAATFYRRRVS
jgi:hypothetical protein